MIYIKPNNDTLLVPLLSDGLLELRDMLPLVKAMSEAAIKAANKVKMLQAIGMVQRRSENAVVDWPALDTHPNDCLRPFADNLVAIGALIEKQLCTPTVEIAAELDERITEFERDYYRLGILFPLSATSTINDKSKQVLESVRQTFTGNSAAYGESKGYGMTATHAENYQDTFGGMHLNKLKTAPRHARSLTGPTKGKL